MPEGTRRRLLAVMAHPDDETFGCGGTLARYSAEGVQVDLICATLGEAGEISDPSLATPETLAQVREGELRAACDVLGVKELFLLGYRDSGMAGTSDNDHPEALCQASHEELVSRIVAVIRQVKPQVIVTFDPSGGYDHPDHVAIHHAAREAYAAASDPTRYRGQLTGSVEAYAPRKLYYFVFPCSIFRAFQEAVKATGDDSDLAKMDPEKVGTPDEEITTVLDVNAYGLEKERAARCHRTQIEVEPFSWLPETLKQRFLSTEHLVRAEPPFPVGQHAPETDLFAGVQL